MTAKRSRIAAGLLMYRVRSTGLEVLLAHPGGPFFVKKDVGHWSIPKGEFDPDDEAPLDAARREFEEETGLPTPATGYLELGSIRQKGGKLVHAWAFAGDVPDGWRPESNELTLEFPKRSGRMVTFPEIDRAEFFTVAGARERMKNTQLPFVERLAARGDLR